MTQTAYLSARADGGVLVAVAHLHANTVLHRDIALRMFCSVDFIGGSAIEQRLVGNFVLSAATRPVRCAAEAKELNIFSSSAETALLCVCS